MRAALLILLSVSCGDKLCPTPVNVVGTSAFTIVPVAADPFETSSSTTSRRCDERDIVVEFLGESETFSINTSNCNRLTVETPLLEPLRAGEQIGLRIWHFAIFDFGPTEATVRIALEDQVIWEQTFPIPSESELLHPMMAMPADYPAGARMVWNVSNHGSNSWNFIELTAERDRVCPEE